mgnify:CR=1 FL=1
MNEHVTLTVPALQAYVLVIRTALGGLALVNDLDMDTLEDLRQAADEACDYLMHQGAPACSLDAWSEGGKLRVTLQAELDGQGSGSSAEELELSKAVLETLIPEVTLRTRADGLVERVELAVPKALA